MSKKLNISAVQNELAGGSAFGYRLRTLRTSARHYRLSASDEVKLRRLRRIA